MSQPHDSRYLDEPEFQSLLVACLESLERGETIDRDALAKDFPQYAEELAKFLDDRRALEDVAASFSVVPSRRIAASTYEATRASGNSNDDFEVGESIRYIGEYEILEEIARGGMGVVFKARQQSLNRIIALKMILAGRLADEADVQRFQREARAAGRLNHTNIVPVHEIGEFEGRHYFTMDYIDGRSLSENVRESSLAPKRAAELVRQVALAVHFAHEQGTLHRDLKPANILLTGDDVPMVTDFGLAKFLDAVEDDTRADLTASGQMLGTPGYMSPEQAAGKTKLVSTASDIYSLGAVLYACLTGRAPFVADSPVDTLLQVMHKEPVSPRLLNPSVPKDLETICLKCLNKERHRRYGTADQLADDLRRFLDGRPVVARPISATAKAFRWARRNRAVASLIALSMVLLAGGTAVSTYFAIEANERADAEANERRRADHTVVLLRVANDEKSRALVSERRALAETQAERDEATKQRERSETLLYSAQMRAAQLELGSKELLEASRHLQASRWDLRGWEFDYLSNRIGPSKRSSNAEGTAEPRSIGQFEGTVRRIALSPNGQFVAAVAENAGNDPPPSNISIRELSTGDVVKTLEGHSDAMTCVAYRQDGMRIVSGSLDNTIKIWDVNSGNVVRTLTGHTQDINDVAFSPDGLQIVSASGPRLLPQPPGQQGELKIWDAQTGELIRELTGHSAAVVTASFSPDQRWIVSGGFAESLLSPGEVRLWDAATGREIKDVVGPLASPDIAALCVIFSPDSQRLVVAGGMGPGPRQIRILTVPTGDPILTLEGHQGTVGSMAFSPDGQRLVSAAIDLETREAPCEVKVWDTDTGVELLELDGYSGLVGQVCWSHNGRFIVGAGGSWDSGDVTIWDATKPADFHLVIRQGLTSAARGVAFSSDGKRLVSGGVDRTVRLWDLDTGRQTQAVVQHSNPIAGVAFAANRIASASADQVIVWDLDRKREILSMGGPAQKFKFQAVACSPDGQRFVAGTSGGPARIWEVTETRRGEVSTLLGHKSLIRGVAFGPEGKHVATASADQTARVWNVETGDPMVSFTGHTSDVACVAFAPDGKRVVTGSFDKTLKVWDAESGHEFLSLSGHTGSVLSVAYSSDGTRIVSGSQDMTVKVWDAHSGALISTLPGHEFYVRSVAISPDSTQIASVSGIEDKTIRVWPCPKHNGTSENDGAAGR